MDRERLAYLLDLFAVHRGLDARFSDLFEVVKAILADPVPAPQPEQQLLVLSTHDLRELSAGRQVRRGHLIVMVADAVALGARAEAGHE